jgi:hypothetical protein
MPAPGYMPDLNSLGGGLLSNLLDMFRANAAIPPNQSVGQALQQRADPSYMWNMLTKAPDPTIGGEMGLVSNFGRAGNLMPLVEHGLIPAAEQDIKELPQGMRLASPGIVLGDGVTPSYVVLQHDRPLSGEEFKNQFFHPKTLPNNVNANVSRLESNLRPENEHLFKIKFEQNGKSVPPPKDFFSRFGWSNTQPWGNK